MFLDEHLQFVALCRVYELYQKKMIKRKIVV